MALVAKNKEFKALHHYYTTRAENPLKMITFKSTSDTYRSAFNIPFVNVNSLAHSIIEFPIVFLFCKQADVVQVYLHYICLKQRTLVRCIYFF